MRPDSTSSGHTTLGYWHDNLRHPLHTVRYSWTLTLHNIVSGPGWCPHPACLGPALPPLHAVRRYYLTSSNNNDTIKTLGPWWLWRTLIPLYMCLHSFACAYLTYNYNTHYTTHNTTPHRTIHMLSHASALAAGLVALPPHHYCHPNPPLLLHSLALRTTTHGCHTSSKVPREQAHEHAVPSCHIRCMLSLLQLC